MRSIFLLLRNICLIIGITIMFLVAGHFLIGVAIIFKQAISPGESSGKDYFQESLLPCFIDYNASDIEQLLRDEKQSGDLRPTEKRPYYHYLTKPYQSKFLNIDQDNLRLTSKEGSVYENAKKVFIFGGSTVYGNGAFDNETIPSHLQKMLGNNYDVFNYGQRGFVFAQELNRLQEQLAFGNIPDIVIFYNGLNDTYNGVYSPAKPRYINAKLYNDDQKSKLLRAFWNILEETNYIKLLSFIISKAGIAEKQKKKWEESIKDHIKINAKNVIDIHEQHIKISKGIADRYGIDMYFYWQPYLFSHQKQLLDGEDQIINGASQIFMEAMSSTYKLAKDRFSFRENEQIYNLSDLFDSYKKPFYIDGFHIVGHANKQVASEMYLNIVKKDLEK